MKEKPQLESEKIEYLKSVFDEDLKILGGWLGIQLNCDNYKEVVEESELNWKITIS